MTPVLQWGMPHTPKDLSATSGADPTGAPWFGGFSLDFATPQLARTIEVWRAKRVARTMPARGDFSIADLKFTLGNLGFLDIVRDDGRMRFRVRLQGSVLDELVAPMTGRFIDEIIPAHFVQKWTGQWMPAIEQRAPMRAVGRVEFAGRRWYVAESLYAPLADDGETPNILMVVAYYHAIDKGDATSRELAARLTTELEAQSAGRSS